MSKSDIPAKPQGYIPVSLGWLLFGMSLPNPDNPMLGAGQSLFLDGRFDL